MIPDEEITRFAQHAIRDYPMAVRRTYPHPTHNQPSIVIKIRCASRPSPHHRAMGDPAGLTGAGASLAFDLVSLPDSYLPDARYRTRVQVTERLAPRIRTAFRRGTENCQRIIDRGRVESLRELLDARIGPENTQAIIRHYSARWGESHRYPGIPFLPGNTFSFLVHRLQATLDHVLEAGLDGETHPWRETDVASVVGAIIRAQAGIQP